jgi:predicted RNA binding protein YcfA (HicA-like mRNA interferase family)
MSEKLPRLTPQEAIKIIEKLGFVLARQSGSHKIYKNAKGIRITVPFHKGKILHPKIVKSILKDTGISSDALRKLP